MVDASKHNNDSTVSVNIPVIPEQENTTEEKEITKYLRKVIQTNLMKGIVNPEEEYQKELEKKRQLRVKARQKYNQGKYDRQSTKILMKFDKVITAII